MMGRMLPLETHTSLAVPDALVFPYRIGWHRPSKQRTRAISKGAHLLDSIARTHVPTAGTLLPAALAVVSPVVQGALRRGNCL